MVVGEACGKFVEKFVRLFIFCAEEDKLFISSIFKVTICICKYTWAPQTVHNTPVMYILKGYFLDNTFLKNVLKKPRCSAKFVNACRREVKKIDGRTESQTDTEWWHSILIYSTLNMWKFSAK